MPEPMGQPLRFTFPGGAIKHITIPATAGNVPTVLSPGPGFRWVVRRMIIRLVTDGTVANRLVVINTSDGLGNVTGAFPTNATAQTATQTRGYVYMPTLEHLGGAVAAYVGLVANLMVGFGELVIDRLESLDINISAGVAGDSYSGFAEVLQMTV